MDLPPESALQLIVGLLKRVPMSDVEAVGAQCAVNALEKAHKELKELKNPPKPSD